MTAVSLLSDTEIADVEGYLSAKIRIGIGSTATISAGDPFSTGSGSVVIYGALDTTVSVSGAATFAAGATVSAGTLTVADTLTAYAVNANVLTTTGIYHETTASSIQTAANYYNLPYTNAGIYYFLGENNPTTNVSVLTQQLIPTDTTKLYTLSLVYYQSSATFYCNAVAVTDSDGAYILGSAAQTYVLPKFSGGLPTFSTSPNLVIQQFSIISIPDTDGVMTRHVVTAVSPFS